MVSDVKAFYRSPETLCEVSLRTACAQDPPALPWDRARSISLCLYEPLCGYSHLHSCPPRSPRASWRVRPAEGAITISAARMEAERISKLSEKSAITSPSALPGSECRSCGCFRILSPAQQGAGSGLLMRSATAGKEPMKEPVFVVVLTQRKAGLAKLGDLLQDGQVGFGDAGVSSQPCACLGAEGSCSVLR